MTRSVDVLVIGGGAAGLAAAVQLGRMRRRVLVVDSGRPRNQPAAQMHGYPGLDGMAPARYLADVRAEAVGYGAELAQGEVTGITGDSEQGFTVVFGDGERSDARRVLVATGITDLLPDIPGVAGHWGRTVIHCPYCHGWEVRDQRLVVIDSTGLGAHQALLFRQLSSDVTLVVHAGPGPDDGFRRQLDLAGVPVVSGLAVSRLEPEIGTAVNAVVLADGSQLACDAVVVGGRFRANLGAVADLQLTLADHPSGLGQVVETGPTGTTSVAGVYAAGNIVDPAHQVLHAAADGSRVAAMMNFDLVHDDLARLDRGRSGA